MREEIVMNLMTDEEKMVRVWRLFRQIKHKCQMQFPSLLMFEDGSGSMYDDRDNFIADWSNYDEATDQLEQYLSER
jgi:hypothetical protein